MAKQGESIIEESKKWLSYFYVNGEWLDEPIKFKVNGREVSEEVMEFLSNFFRFLIEGTMLNECSIIWLTSNLPNIRSAIEFYNSQQLEIDRINLNTAQSKIQYDKNKLAKHFESGILFHLMVDPDKYLESISNKLDSLSRIYMNDSEYNKSMVIKLPKEPLCKEIDDYSWVKLTDVLERYSKKKIALIESGNDKEITADMIGYYNYLISNKKLSNKEKERLKEIRHILNLE